MKNFYQMPLDEVFNQVNSTENGLTSKEASDRLADHGENVLKEKNKKSPVKIFFSQFLHFSDVR